MEETQYTDLKEAEFEAGFDEVDSLPGAGLNHDESQVALVFLFR